MTTILYADDILRDESIRQGYQSNVQDILHHTLLTAINGEEALQQIAGRTSIDLMFLDWRMPVMNGSAVLRELRAKEAQLPVVMCSGDLEEDVRRMVMESGYEHVIGYCDVLSIAAVKKYVAMLEKTKAQGS